MPYEVVGIVCDEYATIIIPKDVVNWWVRSWPELSQTNV